MDNIEKQYCEFLDESGMISIGTLEYLPSEVLREVDPTAYRVGLADYSSFYGEEDDE